MDVQKGLFKILNKKVFPLCRTSKGQQVVCSTILKSVSLFENEYDGMSVWFLFSRSHLMWDHA